jgi:hypothetical protein
MSWRIIAAVVAGGLLLVAPLGARSTAVPAGNLVQNPGAEESPGAADDTVVKPAAWTTTGALSNWQYSARETDRPTQAFSATIGGGSNFFSGGPGGVTGQPTATQIIDVSTAATEIDTDKVAATLSAMIGGYTVSEDLATVTARFLDGAGTTLSDVTIGPVTRSDRNQLTVLLKRAAQANIPKGTRKIAVVIAVKTDNNGKNQAYVDNISLTLNKAVAPSPITPTPTTTPAPSPTLTVTCKAGLLTATLHPNRGSIVSSVTFRANGRKFGLDTKPPFAARTRTTGLGQTVRIVARAKIPGKYITLAKSIRRC